MNKILGHLGIEKLQLRSGGHSTRENGVCLMEAVAWFAGEAHSDSPLCTCPVLAAYARQTNDWLSNQERQLLVGLIPQLVGTRGSLALEIKRAQFLATVAKDVFVPVPASAADAAAHYAALHSAALHSSAYYSASAAAAASAASASAYAARAAYTREKIVTAAIKALVDAIGVSLD